MIEITENENISNVFIAAASKRGWSEPLFSQDERVLSYRAVYRAAFALGRKLKPQKRVGVLLPSSLGRRCFYTPVFFVTLVLSC